MNLQYILRKNAPSILAGLAIFGAGYTAVESVKATPKAMHILEKEKIDPRKEPKEAVKACWKCYFFPAGIFVVTTGSILGLLLLEESDKIKLLAALAYSETKRYEERKLNEKVLGTEHNNTIDDHIRNERFNDSDKPSEPAADGLMWCFEPESEQWFQTSTEKILWAELTANKMFANHGELTFNQFLDLLQGCKKVPWGDHFGWYKYDENGCWDYNWSFYPGGTPWIDIQPIIDVKNDCLVLAYGMHPGDDLDCVDMDVDENSSVD